jgi:hypothetical protein
MRIVKWCLPALLILPLMPVVSHAQTADPAAVPALRNLLPVKGIAVKLTLNQYLYSINRMPGPKPPVNPPTLHATLEISNRSKESIQATVNGQRFDIQLLDADRNVVATWSADKLFPLYIAQETLTPGHTWRYTGEMPVDLQPGNYIARMFTTSTPAWAAEAPFQVEVAY